MSRTKRTSEESPSKMLKNVFFNLWKQDNEGIKDFERYYRKKMMMLVAHYRKMIK